MTTPIGGTHNEATPLSDVLGRDPAPTPPSNELDKDAFLKLLVAQLKYQDPMNPAQGTEFVSQTAQFTTVEKLTDLVDVQGQLLTAQLTTSAAAMIGKSVTYNDAAGTQTGTVTGAMLGTTPSVTVNGLAIPMASVTAIGQIGLAPAGPDAAGEPITSLPSTIPTTPTTPPRATTPPPTPPPTGPLPTGTNPDTT